MYMEDFALQGRLWLGWCSVCLVSQAVRSVYAPKQEDERLSTEEVREYEILCTK